MAKGFLYGNGGSGGGVGLNFRIIGGTSTPSNPKENDIWVNTSVDIPYWSFNSPDDITLRCPVGEDSKVIHADGGTSEHTSYAVSDFVMIPNRTTLLVITMAMAGSAVHHALYDSSKTFVGVIPSELGTRVYTVPSNAAYIKLSMPKSGTFKALAIKDIPTLEDGTLFISTATSSTVAFNALKKNGIEVYPIYAKQYVSGAWVDVEAKSYQNGTWVGWWNGELYKAGREYLPMLVAGSASDPLSKVTYSPDRIVFSFGYNEWINYGTEEPIDLTNFDTVVADFLCKRSASEKVSIYIADSFSKAGASDVILSVDDNKNQDSTITADISNITGKHYVIFAVYGATNAASVDLMNFEIL